MSIQETHKNQRIQVISRATDILRLLGRETGGLSLGQIARAVELPRSTVQRIVAALSAEGFIASDNSSGSIRLGPEILNLAQASTSDMRDRLRPVMQSLSEQTGETVDLAVLQDGRMLFIDQIVGTHRLRTVSSIGESFPLTTTANGKAALACLDKKAARTLVSEELAVRGLNGVAVAEVLMEIDGVRRHGLASDQDEHTDGISALGFAVKDRQGDIFALSIPVPSSRFDRIRSRLTAAIGVCREEFAI